MLILKHCYFRHVIESKRFSCSIRLYIRFIDVVAFISIISDLESNIMYSGISLLRSPTGLGKRDLNGEVTVLQGV